ncbi:MAG: MBL fold metallo-hydrolase [Spirochaetota bacterium]|nr:MBL fold metallo-hydrolase [Spirochaetota bacterium]
MTEEILPSIYRIEIPLPKNPLKALNSYVIKDNDRNLIIDTGMNREECMRVMESSLREIGVDLKDTDFFITHLHADHLGLVSSLVTNTSKIYFNQKDIDSIHQGFSWESMLNFANRYGFPKDMLQDALFKHPGFKYGAKGQLNFTILKEGDKIEIGDYQFECLETPGHTNGHLCLYEPNKKILVSGDHILGDITPNISLWTEDENPLDEYMTSLDKVYKLDIDITLPGHRSIIRDCKKRIQELKRHHQKRVDEVLSIIKSGNKDAFQVASNMSWDLTYDSWDQFPTMQKWFATGEAIAHLKFLEERGSIQKEIQQQRIVYSL